MTNEYVEGIFVEGHLARFAFYQNDQMVGYLGEFDAVGNVATGSDLNELFSNAVELGFAPSAESATTEFFAMGFNSLA